MGRGYCGAGVGARHAVPGGRHYDSMVFYFQTYATVHLFKTDSNNLPLTVNT